MVKTKTKTKTEDQTPLETPKNTIMDFRWGNDAWYAVRLSLKGRNLTLKYTDFTDMFDEHYNADDFTCLKQIEEFTSRFRPTSIQLQDKQCYLMKEGLTVSASYAFGPDDVRFYNALVEAVDYSYHKEEECTCTFLLCWQHGPNVGKQTCTGIENICLLGIGKTDPTLTRFLKICKEKFQVDIHNPGISFEGDNTVYEFSTKQTRPVACSLEEPKLSKRPSHITQKSKGGSKCHLGRTGQDTDLGGTSTLTKCMMERTDFYFMLIDNVEKDLTPAVVVDFINKHVKVSNQALVFPCLPSKVYTNGIIVVASQEELTKLSEFLNDPAQIILSSRGRPWVIPEKQSWNGAVGGNFASLTVTTESQPLDRTPEVQSTLELVSRGTERYEKAKLLRDLFMDFADHLKGLHKRLVLEESKILQSPD